MIRFALILALLTPSAAAEACHRFSVWNYPYPQRCRVVTRVDYVMPPPPSPFPPASPPTDPDGDITLPSLEGMVFPPDAADESGQRLKGVGLLRELLGTN